MFKVMINPGHDCSPTSWGVVDSGAVNEKYNLLECDVVLKIGMKVAEYLEQAGGYTVQVLQQDNLAGENSYSYLYSVCGQANLNKVDLFVSIHADASTNEEAKGTSCYVYQFGTKADRCARHIQAQILDKLGTYDRMVHTAGFSVLRNTQMPAVLVETAFITNEEDVQLLMHRQDDFAKAIALGITDYVKELADD